MNWSGALIVVLFCGLTWYLGYSMHVTCLPSSPEAIRLLRLIGVFFGSLRADGVLNLRGVIMQLTVYSLGPLFSLWAAGVMNGEVALKWMWWPVIVLGILSAVFAVRADRRK